MKRFIFCMVSLFLFVSIGYSWTDVKRPTAKLITYGVLVDSTTPTLIINNTTINSILNQNSGTAALVNISIFNADNSYSIKYASYTTGMTFNDTPRWGCCDELPARTRGITGVNSNTYGLANTAVRGSTVTVTVEYIY